MNVRPYVIVFFICSLFVAAAILRLNDLSLYTPDCTRYVIWGNALAHGQGFVDTTLPDVDRFVVHAPLYALLIAPVELLFPGSLVAVKIWSILWGVVALILFFRWLHRLVGYHGALVGLIILASNPFLLLYSSEALTEVPFIVFTLVVFSLVEHTPDLKEFRSRFSIIFLAVIVAATALLREAGIAVVLTIVVYFLFKRRPAFAVLTIIASVIMLGGWYVRNQILVGPPPGSPTGNLAYTFQHFVTPSQSPLIKELVLRMWLQLKEYALLINGMLLYPYFVDQRIGLILEPSPLFMWFRSMFLVIKYLVIVCVPLLGLAGVVIDLKRTSTAVLRVLFVASYIVIILVYPIHDVRFLVPLLPVMIYYIVRGGQYVFERIARKDHLYRTSYVVLITLLFMLPNFETDRLLVTTNMTYQSSPLGFYQKAIHLPDYPTIFTQPWALIGKWIERNTPEDAVIASPSKELALVVGSRKVLELDPGVTMPLFEMLLRDQNVTYILGPMRWGDVKVYEYYMQESRRFWFEEVYQVSNLHLLRVHSRFAEQRQFQEEQGSVIDTSTVSGLLRAGRKQISEGKYDAAIHSLEGAERFAPLQPEIIYQLITGYALQGDSVNAITNFHKLLTLPQTGSYLYLAQNQLQLMTAMKRAVNRREIESHDVELSNTAQAYWSLQYRVQALAVAKELLKSNSSYYFGLLWGFHYSYQLGETALVHQYLHRLAEIDSTNQVLHAFQRLLFIDDSLRRSSSPRERSSLHISKARLFIQVELGEEAIDEAERAIGEDANNTQALLYLAGLFEQKNRPRKSIVIYKKVLVLDPNNALAKSKIDALEKQLPT
jgi:tetratricopeptide (TPR) repeat protein